MPLSLKRAVRVCAAIAGWLLFDFGLYHLLSLLPSIPYAHVFGPDSPETLIGLLLLAGNLVIFPILLIYWWHRRRGRWIEEEAERWLAERSARFRKPESTGAKKIRRAVLWLPSLLAIVVILFEPEAMGVVSHLFFVGRTVRLSEYRVRTPLTSFLIYWGGAPSLNLMIGRGIFRAGLSAWWRNGYQFESLYFNARPISGDSDFRSYIYGYTRNERVVSERIVPFANGTLTCREIGYFGKFARSPDVADVRCLSSERDFRAEFYGSRKDVNNFYELLERVTHP